MPGQNANWPPHTPPSGSSGWSARLMATSGPRARPAPRARPHPARPDGARGWRLRSVNHDPQTLLRVERPTPGISTPPFVDCMAAQRFVRSPGRAGSRRVCAPLGTRRLEIARARMIVRENPTHVQCETGCISRAARRPREGETPACDAARRLPVSGIQSETVGSHGRRQPLGRGCEIAGRGPVVAVNRALHPVEAGWGRMRGASRAGGRW